MKIVHFHILKTGGTSLNAWLDGLVHAEQVRPSDWGLRFSESFNKDSGGAIGDFNYNTQKKDDGVTSLTMNVRSQEYSRRVRAWWDVIHDHEPGIMALDGLDAFKFVVLRDPIARIMSQLADFRRYSKETINAIGNNSRKKMLIDNQEMEINDFIEKYKDQDVFKNYAENQQVKVISSAGSHYFDESLGDNSLALAKKMIEEGFDLVGLTEKMDEFVEILCFHLQTYPNKLKRLNKTSDSTDTLKGLNEKSLQALKEMNDDDCQLYDFALGKFQSQKLKQPYTIAYFEENYIETSLRKLRPRIVGGNDAFFDMNMPFLGTGLHKRTLPRTEKCFRWTSATELDFYMPTPVDELLRIKIYIRGYVAEPFNRNFELYVDGIKKIPQFKTEEGCREVVQCMAKTVKPYVKVQIKNLACIKKENESRARGMAINGYGYSFFKSYEIAFYNDLLENRND